MPEYLTWDSSAFKWLNPRADRDGKVEYEGHDKPEGDVVKIMVGYHKGGVNYMNYSKIPRGIYVRLSETTIEKTPFGQTESFWIGNKGVWGSRSQSYAIKALARGNPKLLRKIALEIDPIAASLADHFRQGNQVAISAALAQVALKAAA